MASKSSNSRTGEDLILLAIKLAGGPLKQAELVKETGLAASHISYWIPRMIKKGTLLRIEVKDQVLYASQPLLHSDEIEDVLNSIFSTVLEQHEDFFTFGQAEVSVEEVIKTNIAKSLKLYCIFVKDLEAEP